MSDFSEFTWYVNGEYIAAEEASLSLRDVGIVRGYGIFDYFRTYNGKSFRMLENLKRLGRSAERIRLPLPHSLGDIGEIVSETIEKNNNPNVGVRIVVTGGPADDFFTPIGRSSLIVMVAPAPSLAPELYEDGAKVITTRLERTFPKVKSLNYIPAIMAMQDAKAQGAVEALYVNRDDHVLEATRSNVFGIRDGQLITPYEGVLDGITRQGVIDVAEGELDVQQQAITVDELAAFDEVFITSATKEILPVRQVDDLVIGDGRPGPRTKRLMALLKEAIKDSKP